MNESLTVLIERNVEIGPVTVTEPYEVAWASEARWFIVLEDPLGSQAIDIETEISPEGLNWCPLEKSEYRMDEGQVASWSVREFGGWLRLRCSVSGDGKVKGSIYLALKA